MNPTPSLFVLPNLNQLKKEIAKVGVVDHRDSYLLNFDSVYVTNELVEGILKITSTGRICSLFAGRAFLEYSLKERGKQIRSISNHETPHYRSIHTIFKETEGCSWVLLKNGNVNTFNHALARMKAGQKILARCHDFEIPSGVKMLKEHPELVAAHPKMLKDKRSWFTLKKV